MTKNKIKQVGLVFYGKELAGRISKDPKGPGSGFEFEYDAAYLQKPGASPISLAMPLQKEKYYSKGLFPFFEGLLPEGWLLELTSRTLKINPNDEFELLLHTGSDTVGAVTVRPEE
jgi:serine/threonine-protein kinase HipA